MNENRVSLVHIDSDADNRVIVSLALSFDRSIRVQSFESMSAALIGLRGQSVQWDALILDYQAFGDAEWATVDDLRQRARITPAPMIFLTARLLPYEIAAMNDAGALGIIAKPFDPLRLAARVIQLLQT